MTAFRLLVLLLIGALGYILYTGKIAIGVWFPIPFAKLAPVRDHVALVRDLSQKVLIPLEDKNAPSPASAQKAVTDLAAQIDASPGSADCARSHRALGLLTAALQERQALIEKALEKAPEGPFDKTPGIVWHDAWHRDKVIDMEKVQRQLRTSYWAGVYLAQWRTRCAYYRTAIAAALAQT